VIQKAISEENKLIEFRQAVCEHGITRRRDVVFELQHAMIT